MERTVLEEMLAEGLSLAAMGQRLGRHESTVSYWLERYGLRAANAERHAARGGLAREELEALVEEGLTIAEIASLDRSKTTVRHWLKMKETLVAEAGGSCRLCGYNGSLRGLHFHHLDPAQKRFELNAKGVALALDTLRAEARKCVLLCSNCHAEVEDGLVDVTTTG